MRCPQCGHENGAELKFCGECGTRLALLCSECGARNLPSQKFCGECGARLATGTAIRPPSPESYTPKHLAERILTSKAALEGERKQVTVLFADLKGSMELLADRDPEEARKILDPVLELMMEAVHRFEGTVNQVMGDGIMALFGAPIAHEDHAVRACYAALHMQKSVKRASEEMRRTTGVLLAIRVGINSGEVVVRAIGSDLHMDYTAVGHTTHLAARMEQTALPGSTLITSGTLRLVEGFVEIKPMGPIPLKGVGEPVEVYELIGSGMARSRLRAAETRGLTRFVGRRIELEQIRQALERAAAGHGQVVAMVGEAGVGKSRLVYEFTHSHRVQDWLILESSSVSYGKATAYLPVIDLIKAHCKILDRDEPREIRDKVIGRVLGLDRTLEPVLSPLLALLDVPVEDAAWQTLEPPERRQRTLEAVKRLLVRESQLQPLLLVVEDLHWIDRESQALLDSLAESLGSQRILLLVNYRPEYEPRWGKKTYYSQVRLDNLPPESTEELLQGLLGEDPGLEPLKEMLRRRGNPFFLEETVRTLIETDVLAGERGAHRLVRPVQSLQIPATVQAILAARIDRLPVDDKQLLQTASVIGKDVPFAILSSIAEISPERLRSGLARLQTAEFLYETQLFPESEYTFKHALTHEVTYDGLLHARRRQLHGRIVAAIEQLHGDRIAEHAERLAHHATRAELYESAVKYHAQAGKKAFERAANTEAIESFERAVEMLGLMPTTDETLSRTIDLHIDLRVCAFYLGEIRRAFQYISEAQRLATVRGDRRQMARVALAVAATHWVAGPPRDALRWAETGLSLAEECGDLRLRTQALLYVALAFHVGGEHGRAADCFRAVLDVLPDFPEGLTSGAHPPSVFAPSYFGIVLAEQGDFAQALTHAEGAYRLAKLMFPHVLVNAGWALAWVQIVRGYWDRAIPILEANMARLRELQLVVPLLHHAWKLGCCYLHTGRVAEGLDLINEGLDAHDRLGLRSYQAYALTWSSEASLLAERPDDVLQRTGRALALSRERGQRNCEALALRVLGEASLRGYGGPIRDAESYYHGALGLANELGMRPLIAHCHTGLAKLYRRVGEPGKADEEFATATTMYRDMGMTYWLEKAEAEMRDLT